MFCVCLAFWRRCSLVVAAAANAAKTNCERQRTSERQAVTVTGTATFNGNERV